MPVALAGRDGESLGVKADDKLLTWGVSHLPTGVGPRPWGVSRGRETQFLLTGHLQP